MGFARDLWRAITRDTPAFRHTGDWHAVGHDIHDAAISLEHDLAEGAAAALLDPAGLLKTGHREEHDCD